MINFFPDGFWEFEFEERFSTADPSSDSTEIVWSNYKFIKWFILLGPAVLIFRQIITLYNKSSYDRHLDAPEYNAQINEFEKVLTMGIPVEQLKTITVMARRRDPRFIPIIDRKLGQISPDFLFPTTRELSFLKDLRKNLVATREAIAYEVEHHLAQANELWCVPCNTRPKELDLKDNISVIRCPSCRKIRDFREGVKYVHGVIGGANPTDLPETILEIPIWDSQTKSILPAEVDKIILRAQEGLNFNWAIAALARTLEEDPRFRGREIPIQVEEGLELDNNTRTLLANIANRNLVK